jgi:hypothetical protein
LWNTSHSCPQISAESLYRGDARTPITIIWRTPRLDEGSIAHELTIPHHNKSVGLDAGGEVEDAELGSIFAAEEASSGAWVETSRWCL